MIRAGCESATRILETLLGRLLKASEAAVAEKCALVACKED